MKSKLLKILLCLACVCVFAGLTACGNKESAKANLVGVDFNFQPAAEYVRNGEIDYSSLFVTARYDDGSEKTLRYGDENLIVSDNGTDTVGSGYEITVKLGDYLKIFSYGVRNPRVVFHYEDGTDGNGNDVGMIEVTESLTDISEYVAVSNYEDMAFAGWYYDEECKNPVKYAVEGKIGTLKDVDLYAGYDVDYSSLFGYTIENGEVTLDSVTVDFLAEAVLYIPATIELKPVTKIGDDFFATGIMSSDWYDGLVFAENSQVKTIGKSAFAFNKFVELNLPSSLEYIEENAFTSSENITSVEIPASVLQIDNEAFSGCANLISVTFEEGTKLEFIGANAFWFCGLETISIPDGVGIVQEGAFESCNDLIEVRVGKKVNSISPYAFRGCSYIEKIEVDPANANYTTIDGNLYSKDGKKLVRYCFGREEETFTVPDGVTDILEGAFDSYNLQSVLNEIVLPESLQSIWDNAFRQCDATFTIPKNVKNISSEAFAQAYLTEFSISEENPYFMVKDGVLYSKDGKELIAFPYYYANDTYVLDKDVEIIKSGAMTKNDALKFFIVPENSALKKIERRGFVPGDFRTFACAYFEKSGAFAVEEDSFLCENGLLYGDVFFCVGEAEEEAYKTAFDDCYFETNKIHKITDKIVTAKTLPLKIVDKINSLIGYEAEGDNPTLADKTDVELMGAYFDLMYENDFGVNDASSFTAVMNVIASAFGEGDESVLAPIADYLAAFENKMISFLALRYNSYTDEGFDSNSFGMHKSFKQVYEHYEKSPDFIKEAISDDVKEILKTLDEKTDLFIEKQTANKAAMRAMMSGAGRFDPEKAQVIYDEYLKTGLWGIVGKTGSDDIYMFRMDCSLSMLQFAAMEKTDDNLVEARILLNGSYTDSRYGILDYLKYYFKTNSSRAKLYGYSEFTEKYKEYVEYIEEINAEVLKIDLADFDKAAALSAVERFNKLDVTEQSLEAQAAIGFIKFRLAYIAFGDMTVTGGEDGNLYEAMSLFGQIKNNIDTNPDFTATIGATEAEIAKFENNVSAIMKYYSAFRDKVLSINNENYAEKTAKLDDEFQMFNDIAVSDYVEVETSVGTVTTTLSAACASILKVECMRYLIANFGDLTMDTFYDMASYLSDSGFLRYQSAEDGAACDAIYSDYLTNDDILAFNAVIEKYNELYREIYWW